MSDTATLPRLRSHELMFLPCVRRHAEQPGASPALRAKGHKFPSLATSELHTLIACLNSSVWTLTALNGGRGGWRWLTVREGKRERVQILQTSLPHCLPVCSVISASLCIMLGLCVRDSSTMEVRLSPWTLKTIRVSSFPSLLGNLDVRCWLWRY